MFYADNVNVNKKIARLLNIPHVGYLSHKLNLEVNSMVTADPVLTETIASIHETMSNCRRKLKNRAMLRNLTTLSPILHNKTRWLSNFSMLRRFNRIRNQLLKLVDTEGAELTINRTNTFKIRATKSEVMLAPINTGTLLLQEKGKSLADCRDVVDALSDSVASGRDDTTSPFYQCNLKTKWISINAEISSDPKFESGVCKIQRDQSARLTDAEKLACKSLLLEEDQPASRDQPSAHMSLFDAIQERKKRRIFSLS